MKKKRKKQKSELNKCSGVGLVSELKFRNQNTSLFIRLKLYKIDLKMIVVVLFFIFVGI